MAKNPQTEIDDRVLILLQDLVDKFGLFRAAVYSRAEAYASKEDGVCRASHQTIARDLQLSRECIGDHMRALCADGYLKDLTPDRIRHPHEYQVTGKAGIKITISGFSGVSLSDTSEKTGNSGVSYSDTRKKAQKAGVSLSDTTGSEVAPGVSYSDTSGSGVRINPSNLVVVVNPINNKEIKQQHESAERLKAVGVGQAKATALSEKFSPGRINQAIDVYDWARTAGIAQRQGWLINFLEKDWSPPADYVPAADRCPECQRDRRNHAPGCKQRYDDDMRKYFRENYACPVCHQYPCDCEDLDGET